MTASAPEWLPALRRRQVAVFAVVAVVLLTPWPRVGRGFVPAFAAYGNAVARAFDLGGAAQPRFSTPPPGEATATDGGDWAVRVMPRAEAEGMLLDTRVLGYTPVAILFALVAALEVSTRRRLTIFAGALALLLARLGVAIALPLARAYDTRQGAAWAFGAAAELVWNVLVTPPASAYVTPLVAWWLALALTTPKAVAPLSRRARAARR